VRAYPTLFYFKDGKQVARLEGYVADSEFKDRMATYFGL
jgi:thioredoxin-related protein